MAKVGGAVGPARVGSRTRQAVSSSAVAPGEYAAVVGFYDRATGVRLPTPDGDTVGIPPLVVKE